MTYRTNYEEFDNAMKLLFCLAVLWMMIAATLTPETAWAAAWGNKIMLNGGIDLLFR